MRCDEARKRMTEGKLDDPAIAEHIQTCIACAKMAAAERQLSRLLREVVEAEMAPTTPISTVRQRIETIAARGQRKDNRIMSTLFTQFRIHPRLRWGLALAVAFFLFVSLVPFSYQRISGYDATIAFAGVTEGIPQAKVEQALESIGQSNVKVSVEQTGDNTNYRLKGFASESKAFEAVLALEMQAGTKGQSRIRPVLENVSSSLFAQVLDGVKSVKAENTKGKTDQEVEQDITAKMLAAGLLSPKVRVTTNADGTRKAFADAYVRTKAGQDSATIKIMWDMSRDEEIRLRIFTNDSTNTTKVGMPGGKGSTQELDFRGVEVRMQESKKDTTAKLEKIGEKK
jgi:hypothetical protein